MMSRHSRHLSTTRQLCKQEAFPVQVRNHPPTLRHSAATGQQILANQGELGIHDHFPKDQQATKEPMEKFQQQQEEMMEETEQRSKKIMEKLREMKQTMKELKERNMKEQREMEEQRKREQPLEELRERLSRIEEGAKMIGLIK